MGQNGKCPRRMELRDGFCEKTCGICPDFCESLEVVVQWQLTVSKQDRIGESKKIKTSDPDERNCTCAEHCLEAEANIWMVSAKGKKGTCQCYKSTLNKKFKKRVKKEAVTSKKKSYAFGSFDEDMLA